MKFKMKLNNTIIVILSIVLIIMVTDIVINALMLIGVGIFYTENIVLSIVNIIISFLITLQLLLMIINPNYKITTEFLKINYGLISVKIPLLSIYTADIRQEKVCIFYVYKETRKALSININPRNNLLFTDSLTKAQQDLIDSNKK